MSGNISFCVREGASRDPRYEGYPEWYFEVTPEDCDKCTKISCKNCDVILKLLEEATEAAVKENKKKSLTIKVSPKFPEVQKLLVQILVHEIINDTTRDRDPDVTNKVMMLVSDEVFREAQKSFSSMQSLPEIYREVNQMIEGCRPTKKRKKFLREQYQQMMEQAKNLGKNSGVKDGE